MRVKVEVVLDVDAEGFPVDIHETMEEIFRDLLYDLDDTEIVKIGVVSPR